MRNTILFLILGITFNSEAQKHDKNWVMGAVTNTYPAPLFEMIVMTHNEDMNISFDTLPRVPKYRLNSCSASFSDGEGNLKYYSNGKAVYNIHGEIMENGDSINFGYIWQASSQSYPASNSLIPIPPRNSNDSVSYLIHAKVESKDSNGVYFPHLDNILCTSINLNANGGLGSVIYKDILLAEGYFENIAMTRHANGVDWWIVTAYISKNILRSLLFSDGSIKRDYLQTIGPELFDSSENIVNTFGLLSFSHDGKYFARVNLHSGLWVYEFDRCSGLFTGVRCINFKEPLLELGEGVASDFEFSPSGQFLYFMTGGPCYQIDLWKDSLELVQMGYLGNPKYKCHTSHRHMQLAPDGKIYIAPATSSLCLHIIHFPDLPYPDCQFVLNDVELPVYNHGSLVHYPNYRLGPLEGSPCDTLGGPSVVEPSPGLEEVFRLYPNPARGHAQLELDTYLSHAEALGVRMVHSSGVEVYNGVIPPYAFLHTLPLERVGAGMYLVEIMDPTGKRLGMQKLVVE
ncbi:MAG: hypothetical protein J5I41_03645 [Saprospiraceae bacterium]|nr:hypothetical protein [Saprospiraceae bacterium]